MSRFERRASGQLLEEILGRDSAGTLVGRVESITRDVALRAIRPYSSAAMIFGPHSPTFAAYYEAQGLQLYRAREFSLAFDAFSQAVRIDPELHLGFLGMLLCLKGDSMLRRTKAYMVTDLLTLGQRSNAAALPEVSHASYLPLYALLASRMEPLVEGDFFRQTESLLDDMSRTASTNPSIFDAPLLKSVKGHLHLVESHATMLSSEAIAAAIECYGRANELSGGPGRASSFRGIAELEELRGNTSAAMRNVDQSIRVLPSYPYAHISRGIILWRHGELERAASSFQRGWRLLLAMPVTNGAYCLRNDSMKPNIVQLIEQHKTFEETELITYLQAHPEVMDDPTVMIRLASRRATLDGYGAGYCPHHLRLPPYFVVRHQKGRDRLVIMHYVPGRKTKSYIQHN